VGEVLAILRLLTFRLFRNFDELHALITESRIRKMRVSAFKDWPKKSIAKMTIHLLPPSPSGFLGIKKKGVE